MARAVPSPFFKDVQAGELAVGLDPGPAARRGMAPTLAVSRNHDCNLCLRFPSNGGNLITPPGL